MGGISKQDSPLYVGVGQREGQRGRERERPGLSVSLWVTGGVVTVTRHRITTTSSSSATYLPTQHCQSGVQVSQVNASVED